MGSSPRVTLGIATYERDTYLEEAVRSCLRQDYEDLEVLVVMDGSQNPRIEEILEALADPRLRVVRHERNRGISEAYNTIVREGRGELIAMLGDDDVCEPGRIRRQVEVFDRHPDTGVVHGDAIMIDGDGARTGEWRAPDLAPGELLRLLVRTHNYLIDPTRMVHRRVYEDVGGYDSRYRLAQDFDFWMRAVPRHRFRHVEPGGAPLIRFRRHGENFSDESARALEIEEVERALGETIDRLPLRQLVPELDWAVLDEQAAERRAYLRLAEVFEARQLPLPGLAGRMRDRAAELPAPVAPALNGRKLLITAFGWNDSGGGTTVPRLAAKELARRGWDVTVFHATTHLDPNGEPYRVREWEEDSVKLVGVDNRAHGLWDLGNPGREVDDPMVTLAFRRTLDAVQPDVVHFHNLHNLGAALIDEVAGRGIPSFFSTHNYWLLCPRGYLMRGDGALCPGPGDFGGDCASCVGSADHVGHQQRLLQIRDRFTRGIGVCMAVSDAMRNTLIASGYDAGQIDVVRQAMPAAQETWEVLGRDREPGRVADRLVVAFFGSAYPHKGPQVLVQAAQKTGANIVVRIHGEVPKGFDQQLHAMDRRGVVEVCGSYSPSELPDLLAGVDVAVMPSLWWDCAPLMAHECLAGRVPLLAPRMGGLGESVRDGVDGLYFDAFDPGDLAAKLDRLAGEDGLLETLQAQIEAPRAFGAYVDELEAYYAGDRPSQPAAGPPARVAARWVGDHTLHTSLSTINREVAARLQADVQRVERDGRVLDPPLPRTADVEVRHQWPPDMAAAPSGRLVLIQPWEFGAIPSAWGDDLRNVVDEIWVPSAYVRDMYVAGGVPEDRVQVVPNGVDLDRFTPEGPPLELDAPAEGRRFLFVGGAIGRKGIDVLLTAWQRAFAGRDDVTLIVKDFGGNGVYASADRSALRQLAEPGRLPRVVLIEDDLSDADQAALFRSCDVLVHPYRGEGFAMPVLEAMASGLPVIATQGGPTDEFLPDDAGWRLRSRRAPLPGGSLEGMPTVSEPWWLEPDADHLVTLLQAAADAPADELRARGEAGRSAALAFGWDEIAAQYDARLRDVAARPPKLALAAWNGEPRVLDGAPAPGLLATPAWRGRDELAALLSAWHDAAPRGSTDAVLYLLADPELDGDGAALEAHVMAAVQEAGIDLEACSDIVIHRERALLDRDRALHAATAAYVPIHGGCAGHARMAAQAGNAVLAPTAEALRGWLATQALAPTAH